MRKSLRGAGQTLVTHFLYDGLHSQTLIILFRLLWYPQTSFDDVVVMIFIVVSADSKAPLRVKGPNYKSTAPLQVQGPTTSPRPHYKSKAPLQVQGPTRRVFKFRTRPDRPPTVRPTVRPSDRPTDRPMCVFFSTLVSGWFLVSFWLLSGWFLVGF